MGMDVEGLKAQAKSLNPVVGFWDPLNLSGGEFWGDSNAATIGFLREAEIKHGRVAMAGFVGFFEFWRENSYVLKEDGETHYMRGGKPGYFPTFDQLPHPGPFNLFDPFKFSKNASPEKKKAGLLKEINNGRLAQIGLFGFISEAKVPGSVPALTGLVQPYDGDVMAPF